MNPIAILFWMFLGGVGYLLGGVHDAVLFAVVGMGLSLLISLIRR